jgi:SAM-dependent methyltransferase
VHDTARHVGEAFFRLYGKPGDRILDIGSMDVNGTLKPFIPKDADYIGCDIAEGPNVDRVVSRCRGSLVLPWHKEFDLVVSTSCFEHDDFFWETFVAMCDAAKPGGFIYINAPTNGPVHRHPVDCWRFYPDAGLALCKWAARFGHDARLIESFTRPTGREGWSDFIAVFGIDGADHGPSLSIHFSDHYNKRVMTLPS